MDDGFIQQFHESLLSYCPIKGIPYAGTDAKAPCQGDPTTGVWTSGPARGL